MRGNLPFPSTCANDCLHPRRSREGSSGKKYYTLEALLFFIRNSAVSHASYVKTAAAAKIPG